MFLFACHHVARAHRAVLDIAALTYADTAQRRPGKAPLVFDELEVRLEYRRGVFRAEAEIRIEWIGIDDLAWIHPVIRVPYRLELAECADKVRSEHPVEQLA